MRIAEEANLGIMETAKVKLVASQIKDEGLNASFDQAIANNPGFARLIADADIKEATKVLTPLVDPDHASYDPNNAEAFKAILDDVAQNPSTFDTDSISLKNIAATVNQYKAEIVAENAATATVETTTEAEVAKLEPEVSTAPIVTPDIVAELGSSDPVEMPTVDEDSTAVEMPTVDADSTAVEMPSIEADATDGTTISVAPSDTEATPDTTVTPSLTADFSKVGTSIEAMKTEFAKIPNSEDFIQVLNDDPKFAEQLHGAMANDSSVPETFNAILNGEGGQELLSKITEGLQNDTNRQFFGKALEAVDADPDIEMSHLLGFVEASENLKANPRSTEAKNGFIEAAQGVGLDEGDANEMMIAGVQDNLMSMIGNFFEDPSGTMAGWADALEGADFPGAEMIAGLLEKLGPILDKVFGFVEQSVEKVTGLVSDFTNSVGDPKAVTDVAKVTEFDKAELTDKLETTLEELKETDGEISAKYAGNRLEAIDPAFKKEMELIEQDPDLNNKFNTMMRGETSDVARRMVEMHEEMQNGAPINDAVNHAAKMAI